MKNNKKQSIGVNKMYHLNSFFAGIGGFDLGFEKNGFKTEFLCEINPFCNEVLSTALFVADARQRELIAAEFCPRLILDL